MDPLWKGRYMRQSSREAKESQNASSSSAPPVQHPAAVDTGDKKGVGGRRYSGTGLPSIEGANSSQVSNEHKRTKDGYWVDLPRYILKIFYILVGSFECLSELLDWSFHNIQKSCNLFSPGLNLSYIVEMGCIRPLKLWAMKNGFNYLE